MNTKTARKFTGSVKPMDGAEYRIKIQALGLTQDNAAHFLDIALRTSHGYANGDPVPRSVALLLRAMIRHKLAIEDVVA